MTFQGKSLWVTLAGLLVAFAACFWGAWASILPTPMARDLMPHQAGLFMATTVLLVVILVAGHIAIALFDRHSEPDERDRWIGLQGSRWGGFVWPAACSSRCAPRWSPRATR